MSELQRQQFLLALQGSQILPPDQVEQYQNMFPVPQNSLQQTQNITNQFPMLNPNLLNAPLDPQVIYPAQVSSSPLAPQVGWANSGPEINEWISNISEVFTGHSVDPNLIETDSYCGSSLNEKPQVLPAIQLGDSGRPMKEMAKFPAENLQDFKHVLYNLLVDNFNNPRVNNFVLPCTIEENGTKRLGFRFNSRQNPEKKIPELYAQHIRKARLDWEDQSSVFIQDLYKYYMRACVELLSKYFDKKDKFTYLYDGTPLFIPGETLEEAEERLKGMKTRARKKRKLVAAKSI